MICLRDIKIPFVHPFLGPLPFRSEEELLLRWPPEVFLP
jgi:hypothetical protein